jgi:hypothetical protein
MARDSNGKRLDEDGGGVTEGMAELESGVEGGLGAEDADILPGRVVDAGTLNDGTSTS